MKTIRIYKISIIHIAKKKKIFDSVSSHVPTYQSDKV